MRKTLFILALGFCLQAGAGTEVKTESSFFGLYKNQATVTITGKEAMKLWNYLLDVSENQGAQVVASEIDNKLYLDSPGASCVAKAVKVKREGKIMNARTYTCEIKFSSDGSVVSEQPKPQKKLKSVIASEN